MSRILLISILVLLAAPAVARAQAADAGPMATAEGLPEGWLMRFDRSSAGTDMADFQVMEPGWHVKTGRAGAAIFWQPGFEAEGEFTLRTTYHLFSPRSHAESFGLFVGGDELGGAEQEYLYFLVRQTGEYLIKRRSGESTENVVGWTAHDAVPEAPAGEEGPTQYDLAIEADASEVTFLVNGTRVHSLPRPDVDVDGLAGLRINHMLDLHVEELVLE